MCLGWFRLFLVFTCIVAIVVLDVLPLVWAVQFGLCASLLVRMLVHRLLHALARARMRMGACLGSLL